MSPMEFLPKTNTVPATQFGPKVPDLPSHLNMFQLQQKKQERTTKHADFPIQPFKENTSEGHHSSLSEIEKHKLEADAVRYKMEAEDAIEARDESDRQLKALSEECSNLKIKLNSERARHADTAEQSRALTHLAAQLRLKNEKLDKLNDKSSLEVKQLKKRAVSAESELITQTARVDALTKICQERLLLYIILTKIDFTLKKSHIFFISSIIVDLNLKGTGKSSP